MEYVAHISLGAALASCIAMGLRLRSLRVSIDLLMSERKNLLGALEEMNDQMVEARRIIAGGGKAPSPPKVKETLWH